MLHLAKVDYLYELDFEKVPVKEQNQMDVESALAKGGLELAFQTISKNYAGEVIFPGKLVAHMESTLSLSEPWSSSNMVSKSCILMEKYDTNCFVDRTHFEGDE